MHFDKVLLKMKCDAVKHKRYILIRLVFSSYFCEFSITPTDTGCSLFSKWVFCLSSDISKL